MHKLDGKRALVTAGAQGIGLAISRQLLAAGCDVFVHYRSSADAARGLEMTVRVAARVRRNWQAIQRCRPRGSPFTLHV